MDFIWECMVLAVKTTIGGFFWSLIFGGLVIAVGLTFSMFNNNK